MFTQIKKLFTTKNEVMEIDQELNTSILSDNTLEPSATPIENNTDYLFTAPEIVGWFSTQEQEILFGALLLFYNKTQSILDVGCARCDLYGYMKRLNLLTDAGPLYKGIDYNQNLLNIASQKFENINVECVDILNDESNAKFDWVIGSGLFNVNNQSDMTSYAKQCIDQMYNKANVAVAFNLLTDYPEDLAQSDIEALYKHDAANWLSYLIDTYTKVICRADYMTGDVTFFILK